MSHAKNGYCTACSSGQLQFRPGHKHWYCRLCGHTFLTPVKKASDRPEVTKHKYKSTEGLIKAGCTYRQLMAREILAANERARAKHV